MEMLRKSLAVLIQSARDDDLLSVLDFGNEFGNQQHSAPSATGDGFTSVVLAATTASGPRSIHVPLQRVSRHGLSLCLSVFLLVPLDIDGLFCRTLEMEEFE